MEAKKIETFIMKKLLRRILELSVRLYSRVYTLEIHERMKYYHHLLYSMWMSNFLGEVGDGVLIMRPMSLQGGGGGM